MDWGGKEFLVFGRTSAQVAGVGDGCVAVDYAGEGGDARIDVVNGFVCVEVDDGQLVFPDEGDDGAVFGGGDGTGEEGAEAFGNGFDCCILNCGEASFDWARACAGRIGGVDFIGYRIDCDGLGAWSAAVGDAFADFVLFPVETVDVAGMENPEIGFSGPLGTVDAALEDAGDAGWSDGLTGGDDAGVGDGANGLAESLSQERQRKQDEHQRFRHR